MTRQKKILQYHYKYNNFSIIQLQEAVDDEDPWSLRSSLNLSLEQENDSSESEYGTDNIFQLLIKDMLRDHKSRCVVPKKCRTCELNEESIQDWDKNHR